MVKKLLKLAEETKVLKLKEAEHWLEAKSYKMLVKMSKTLAKCEM